MCCCLLGLYSGSTFFCFAKTHLGINNVLYYVMDKNIPIMDKAAQKLFLRYAMTVAIHILILTEVILCVIIAPFLFSFDFWYRLADCGGYQCCQCKYTFRRALCCFGHRFPMVCPFHLEEGEKGQRQPGVTQWRTQNFLFSMI